MGTQILNCSLCKDQFMNSGNSEMKLFFVVFDWTRHKVKEIKQLQTTSVKDIEVNATYFWSVKWAAGLLL